MAPESLVPNQLSEWTIDAITTLLVQGYRETEVFDFKEMLPDTRNRTAKRDLDTDCAAFANAGGGFLIFGVADDSSKKPVDRVVGIDPATDFPEHFGAYARRCEPSVKWRFRNPALRLPSGRVVHVVEIPRSWEAPHAVKDENGGLLFPKRTNKGTELMSYNEIRLTYLGYYEKRLKLQLLMAELQSIAHIAQLMQIPDANVTTQHTLLSLDLQVLETTLSDTYTVLADQPEIVDRLRQIRTQATIVNNEIRMFSSVARLSFTNKEEMIRQHNMTLRQPLRTVASLASETQVLLRRFLD
jgi:hypothetical protein